MRRSNKRFRKYRRTLALLSVFIALIFIGFQAGSCAHKQAQVLRSTYVEGYAPIEDVSVQNHLQFVVNEEDVVDSAAVVPIVTTAVPEPSTYGIITALVLMYPIIKRIRCKRK